MLRKAYKTRAHLEKAPDINKLDPEKAYFYHLDSFRSVKFAK